MPKKRTRTLETGEGWSMGRTAAGGLLGLLLTVVCTFIAALLLHNEILPMAACGWLGPVIIALSACCAALVATRHNGKKLICGLLSAGIYGLSMVICGMLLFSSPMDGGRMLLSAGALVAGTLGGVFLSAVRE